MSTMAKHRRRIASAGVSVASLVLAVAACTSKQDEQVAARASTTAPALVASVQAEQRKCTDEPRTDEHDTRPRCGGMAVAAAPQAYRVVGGSGDPVDQVVCDISDKFVLDGNINDPQFSLNENMSKKFSSSMANSLGISVESLARGVGSVGSGAAKGIGDSIGKLIRK